MIGLYGTEGKVLCRDAHLCERVEEGALAHIGQPHNSDLQADTEALLAYYTLVQV